MATDRDTVSVGSVELEVTMKYRVMVWVNGVLGLSLLISCGSFF